MVRFPLILSALLCFSLTSHARLGDTERECFRRYGSPIRIKPGLTAEILIPGAQHIYYLHEGWRITTAYLNGKVAAQTYRKKVDHPVGYRISEDELAQLLAAESAGGTWRKQALSANAPGITAAVAGLFTGITDTTWKRSDGAIATLGFTKDRLMLITAEATTFIEVKKEMDRLKKKQSIPKF